MKSYASNPLPKKLAAKKSYASNPLPKKLAAKNRYASNPLPKKLAAQKRYTLNPLPKKLAAKNKYASNPLPKKLAMQKWYVCKLHQKNLADKKRYRNHSLMLQKQYYQSIVHRRAARLLHHALHRVRENLKNKVYRMQNKQKISSAKKTHYAIKEPKLDTKQMYVKLIKQRIAQKPSLRRKLLNAFKSARKPLAEKIKTSKLAYAVLSIASRRLLQRVLKVRKQSVGELLACIRAVNSLKISDDDFGESRHTASSEPFFYDQSYCPVKHTSPIVVDHLGRCVIAEEEGERDVKTSRPKRWKCTSECKLPTSMEVKCIKSLKDLFDKPVRKLREALNGIDSCSEHGHYTCPLVKGEEAYHELAGHPLPCSMVNAECDSSLRILRAAATHFPLLRRFIVLLYEAIIVYLRSPEPGSC